MKLKKCHMVLLIAVISFAPALKAQSDAVSKILQKSWEDAERKQKGLTVYENKEYGFSIEKYEHWIVSLADSECLIVKSPQQDGFLFIQPAFPEEQESAAEWITDFLDHPHPELGIGLVKDDDPFEIDTSDDDVEKVTLTKMFMRQGKKLKVRIESHLDNSYGILFGIASTEDYFDIQEIFLMRMVNSFKLEKWEDPRFREHVLVRDEEEYDDEEMQADADYFLDNMKQNKTSSASGEVSLSRHLIHDPQFGMEVARCLIPDDWQFSAEIIWDWQKAPPQAFPVVSIHNQNGSIQLHVLPRHSFFYSNNMMHNQTYGVAHGYVILDIMELQDYLEQIILPNYMNYIGEYSIVEQKDLSQVAAKIRKETFNNAANSYAFAGEFRIRHYFNGVPFISAVTIIFNGTFEQAYMTQTKMWNASCVVLQVPASLEENNPQVQMILNSFKWNKAWTEAHRQFAAWYNQQVILAARANSNVSVSSCQNRYQQISQTLSETSDIVDDGYWYSSSSQYNISNSFQEYIYSEETYSDPYARDMIKLDNTYNSVWTNGMGEYKASQDPGFDASTHYDGNWYKLEVADDY
ncbi:hypothetical protein JW935_17560 [candidate division KSB1 bacterium]|nr:hypothetical protein [candidate division KSB1 bacterium]